MHAPQIIAFTVMGQLQNSFLPDNALHGVAVFSNLWYI